MGKHKSSKAYGVRLPHEMWDAIDAEAESLGMSRNEWLSRKLSKALSAPRELSKIAKDERETEVVNLP